MIIIAPPIRVKIFVPRLARHSKSFCRKTVSNRSRFTLHFGRTLEKQLKHLNSASFSAAKNAILASACLKLIFINETFRSTIFWLNISIVILFARFEIFKRNFSFACDFDGLPELLAVALLVSKSQFLWLTDAFLFRLLQCRLYFFSRNREN